MHTVGPKHRFVRKPLNNMHFISDVYTRLHPISCGILVFVNYFSLVGKIGDHREPTARVPEQTTSVAF